MIYFLSASTPMAEEGGFTSVPTPRKCRVLVWFDYDCISDRCCAITWINTITITKVDVTYIEAGIYCDKQ